MEPHIINAPEKLLYWEIFISFLYPRNLMGIRLLPGSQLGLLILKKASMILGLDGFGRSPQVRNSYAGNFILYANQYEIHGPCRTFYGLLPLPFGQSFGCWPDQSTSPRLNQVNMKINRRKTKPEIPKPKPNLKLNRPNPGPLFFYRIIYSKNLCSKPSLKSE